MKSERGNLERVDLNKMTSKPPVGAWKTKLEERSRTSASNKSTQSGGSSPQFELECDESLEGLQIPCSPIMQEFPEPAIFKPAGPKGSSSFIQEIHGVQPPPPGDYESLDIEEFEDVTLWQPTSLSFYKGLVEKENDYLPDPNCFDARQPNLSPKMRAILLDWMMEVCSEFTLKRETFHLAMSYVDRFVSNHPCIKKQEFQLVGLSAMYLAAKTEEIYSPKISDFAKAADNGYGIADIREMEKLLLYRLSWRVFPGTAYNYTSWLMTQWDSYIEYHFGCVKFNNPKDFEDLPSIERKEQTKLFEQRFIAFKYSNQYAYKRYRETMQILDVSCLDSHVLKLSPRKLAAGLLYLTLSKYFFESGYTLLYYNGPEFPVKKPQHSYQSLSVYFGGEISEELTDSEYTANYENATIVQELYTTFLNAAMDIKNIEEIYHSVAFLHPYLEFPAVYDLPSVCKVQSKARLESHYEEFLAYQTHNANNIQFVTSMTKNVPV
jgi:hypothetical protein